jgi:hypothetical protein
MPRARDALLAAVFVACTPAPEGGSAPPSPTAEEPEVERPSPPAGRTANEDRRGFANQPDYDAEAALLKEQVTPRLPAPPAKDREQACAAMWAAVDGLYADIEADAGSRERTLKALQATRAADLAACERETSVRAAACVTVLLGDRNAELPWLLDQCSRAFPE